MSDTLKNTPTEEIEEAAVQEAPRFTTVVGVSFRNATKTYYFDPGILKITPNDHVIVETARGTEYAKVVFGNKEVPTSTVVMPLKRVIRIATEQDAKRNEDNRAAEIRARKIGEEKIAKHKLEMKLVDVEYTFDWENGKITYVEKAPRAP